MKRITLDELKGGMYVLRFDKPGVYFNYYGSMIPETEVASIKTKLQSVGVQYLYVKNPPAPVVPAKNENDDEPQPEPILEQEPSAAIDDTTPTVIEAEKPADATPADYATIVQTHLQAKYTHEEQFGSANIRDVAEAQKIHTRAKEITKGLLTEVRLGKAVDTSGVKTIINDLLGSCFKNPEAFVNMTRLKDFDDYTFTHSVNVAVLAMSIGKRLGMSPNDLEILGTAALLHDVGKMHVPETILNKPGKLTDDEFDIMKLHPIFSYDILKEDASISPEVIKACRQHHEKSDGSGYPDGLKENQISKYAKIIAISDVYDAITSERVYHKGMIAHDALKLLFSWSGKHFNEILVKFFISLIGIYPVGSAVLLNTGEIAVVFESNKRDSTRPKVILVTDANKQLCQLMLFDLAQYNLKTRIHYKDILSTLNGKELTIDTNDVIAKYIKLQTPPSVTR